MDCPVCPRTEIPDDAQSCPACGANLGPVRRAVELAASFYNDAVRLAKAGAIEAATLRLGAALALDENCLPARRLLGKLLWQQGRGAEAMWQWEQAAAAPEDQEAKRLLEEGRRKLRQRATRRKLAFAAATLAALALLLALFVPLVRLGRRLETIARILDTDLRQAQAALAEREHTLATYRAAHSHPDADYEALLARAETTAAALENYRATHAYSNDEVARARDQASKKEAEARKARLACEQALLSLRTYKETHTRTDAEFARLEAELSAARAAAQKAVRELADYRTSHTHSNTEFDKLEAESGQRLEEARAANARLMGEIAACREEVARLCQELAALDNSLTENRAEITQAREATRQTETTAQRTLAVVSAQTAGLGDALARFFERHPPPCVAELMARMEDATAEVSRLREKNNLHAAPRPAFVSPLLVPARLVARWRLSRAERRLDALRKDYEATVTPWQRLIHRLRTLEGAPSEGHEDD